MMLSSQFAKRLGCEARHTNRRFSVRGFSKPLTSQIHYILQIATLNCCLKPRIADRATDLR